jgi:hypothetical protein
MTSRLMARRAPRPPRRRTGTSRSASCPAPVSPAMAGPGVIHRACCAGPAVHYGARTAGRAGGGGVHLHPLLRNPSPSPPSIPPSAELATPRQGGGADRQLRAELLRARGVARLGMSQQQTALFDILASQVRPPPRPPPARARVLSSGPLVACMRTV